jgi:ubiquinone/menaquinone biosynthesis C-methylase UbiE
MPDQGVLFPGRFTELAEIYRDGRPTYPKLLARRVAAHVALTPAHAVLDLGTGPGFLAFDFAPYAGSVIGVDPEPAMLEVARETATHSGVDVTFIESTAEALPDTLGPFRLVTIGRAFHWMDRARVLNKLDTLIQPGGAIALFQESYPNVPANAWYASYLATLDRHAVRDPAKPITSGRQNHEATLLESAFAHLERISVIEARRTPVEALVRRALSFGRVYHAEDGAQPERLAREVRKGLEPFVQDGVVDEVLEGAALIAQRRLAD